MVPATSLAGVLVLSVVIGSFLSLIRIPGLRRKLERQVLRETGAQHGQPRRLPARCATSSRPWPSAPASRSPASPSSRTSPPTRSASGTRPKKTIIGITSGLDHHLNRDELEAVLSYEVSRIGSWDIALSSWAVALTSGAIAAAEADDLKALVGWVPARMAEWLQAWALRDQGEDRDRVAIQFTRHPEALITALEKLEADQGQIIRVSRATAPLWLEVPDGVYGGALSSRSKRLGTSLLLRSRIGHLTELAGLPPRPILPKTGRGPLLPPPPDTRRAQPVRPAASAGLGRWPSRRRPRTRTPHLPPPPTQAPPPPHLAAAAAAATPPERGRRRASGSAEPPERAAAVRRRSGRRLDPEVGEARAGSRRAGVLLGQRGRVGVGGTLETGLDGQRDPAARSEALVAGPSAWRRSSVQNMAVLTAKAAVNGPSGRSVRASPSRTVGPAGCARPPSPASRPTGRRRRPPRPADGLGHRDARAAADLEERGRRARVEQVDDPAVAGDVDPGSS